MELYIKGIGILSAAGSNENIDFINAEKPENYYCKEPDYTAYIPPMQLRRMSKAVRMGIGASKIALQEAGIDKLDAISIGTSMGCLADTEVFLSKLIDQQEQMLTPTAFIQSTHNTVGGQIALLNGCNGHNLTYVHRGHSFEQAMMNAYLYLQEHKEENMLVGGIDELTPTSEAILREFGIEDNGEGAGFFVMNVNEKKGACIKDIQCFTAENIIEVKSQLHDFLIRNEKKISDVDHVVLGSKKDDEIYESLKQDVVANNINYSTFKNLSGDYGTSSAFALASAVHFIDEKSLNNILIVTNFLDSWSFWLLSN